MAPDPLGPGSDDLVHRPLWLRLALPVLLLAMGLGFGALGGWFGMLVGFAITAPIALLAWFYPDATAALLSAFG